MRTVDAKTLAFAELSEVGQCALIMAGGVAARLRQDFTFVMVRVFCVMEHDSEVGLVLMARLAWHVGTRM